MDQLPTLPEELLELVAASLTPSINDSESDSKTKRQTLVNYCLAGRAIYRAASRALYMTIDAWNFSRKDLRALLWKFARYPKLASLVENLDLAFRNPGRTEPDRRYEWDREYYTTNVPSVAEGMADIEPFLKHKIRDLHLDYPQRHLLFQLFKNSDADLEHFAFLVLCSNVRSLNIAWADPEQQFLLLGKMPNWKRTTPTHTTIFY
jgi:hypothetical protein